VGLVACGAPPPPAAPANRGDHVAPPALDSDGDGIPDAVDRCPHEPEDYDLFADDDGCPDPDNDNDGTPDTIDDCPYEAGPVANHGCTTPCHVWIHDSDDCWADPSVFFDAHDTPQPARMADIVATVHAHPMVQSLEVTGQRSALVAAALRAELPNIDIVEKPDDIPIKNGVWVRIGKQRFGEGRFRTMDCTAWGGIYKPARQPNCTR
jgi:hypothetical protein